MKSALAFRIAAILGFLAVALGAFGAHGLEKVLVRNNATPHWKTAAFYHLVHAAVLLFIAAREPFAVWAWRLFFVGTLVFSGSLYVLAVINAKWLGAITPLGGVCLLGGWLALAFEKSAHKPR